MQKDTPWWKRFRRRSTNVFSRHCLTKFGDGRVPLKRGCRSRYNPLLEYTTSFFIFSRQADPFVWDLRRPFPPEGGGERNKSSFQWGMPASFSKSSGMSAPQRQGRTPKPGHGQPLCAHLAVPRPRGQLARTLPKAAYTRTYAACGIPPPSGQLVPPHRVPENLCESDPPGGAERLNNRNSPICDRTERGHVPKGEFN